MIRSMMALALNPNITTEQFKTALEEHVARQERMTKHALEMAETLPPEQRTPYLLAAMQLLVSA